MPKKLEPDSVRIIDLPAPESPSGAVSVRYTLYRSRRRTIGFRVDSTGISVLAPMRAPIRLIEMSLVRNSSWVIKHLAVRAKQREESENRFRGWGRTSLSGPGTQNFTQFRSCRASDKNR